MKYAKIVNFLLASAVVFGTVACDDKKDETTSSSTITAVDFDFSTSSTVQVQITVPAYLKGAVFELYTANPEFGGRKIAKAQINQFGSFIGTYVLPKLQAKLYLKSTFLGMEDRSVDIKNGTAMFDFKNKQTGYSGKALAVSGSRNKEGAMISYLGGFDNNGIPNYIESKNKVTLRDLSKLQASLPEGKSVVDSKPQWVNKKNKENLELKSVAEVWLTFLNESSLNRNALGFYTYKLGSHPEKVSEIENITIVLPNASKVGSGGGLNVGDRIRLGAFPPNTGIGWVVYENGWNGAGVNVNVPAYYSHPKLNGGACEKQSIQLLDFEALNILVGFEDSNRSAGKGDDDFNDLSFLVSVNPFQQVDFKGIPEVEGASDKDKDGVYDELDDYPSNSNKAFDNYLPFEGGKSAVAFEDLWPNKNGTFDFNDLVVQSSYKNVTNASNQLVEMKCDISISAMGASYRNGYGIQLPFSPEYVKSVSGNNLTQGIINVASNGTEAGQSKAVIIVFDDAFDNLNETLKLKVELETPQDYSSFNGNNAVNPFLIVDGDRGREVHLMNYEPTDKINPAYFGMAVDRSSPEKGIYYKSDKDMPWAIHVSHDFVPSVEGIAIHKAYLNFNDWLLSSGEESVDWYEDRSGYRNQQYLVK